MKVQATKEFGGIWKDFGLMEIWQHCLQLSSLEHPQRSLIQKQSTAICPELNIFIGSTIFS